MWDDQLARWVEQPPTVPTIQYLRDEEKERAWEQLGSRDRVLDVASEVNVTRGIDADEVVRLDFGAAASEKAEELLSDSVAEFHRVDPGDPDLPFDDDAFDGGVSIGPYDWRFLDVDALGRELRRATRPDGRFVFSVPTPRSPYWVGGRNRIRYFEPGEALELFSPTWALDDFDLVYQYPHWFHRRLTGYPALVQRVFAAGATRLSDRLTARENWDDASYLVFAVRPLDLGGGADAAVARLFRSAADGGHWDPDAGWFVGDGEAALDAPSARALAAALRWRASHRGSGDHDERIGAALDAAADRLDAVDSEESAVLGPLCEAFSVSAEAFGEERLDAARGCESRTADADFDDPADADAVAGWAALHERDPTDDRRQRIERGLYGLAERHDPTERLFYPEASPTLAEEMRVVRAVGRGVEAVGREAYLPNAARTIERAASERLGATPEERAAFAAAVAGYRTGGGGRRFDRAAGKALEALHPVDGGPEATVDELPDLDALGAYVLAATALLSVATV